MDMLWNCTTLWLAKKICPRKSKTEENACLVKCTKLVKNANKEVDGRNG